MNRIFSEQIIMGYLIIFLALLSTSAFSSEFSLYKGLATTHLVGDNSTLNNNNDVTIIKYRDYIVGDMTNSYNNSGKFLGWLPKMYDWKGMEFYAGASIVEGYTRQQLSVLKHNDKNKNDQVLMVMPIFSVSYEVSRSISLQLNNMGFVVINAGIRVDF